MDKKFLKKVIAQSPSDLQYISACCSEAKTKIKDIKYLPKNKLFLISIQRLNKEQADDKTRINSIVKFEYVDSSKSKNINQKNKELILELITINLLKKNDKYEFNLLFSNNGIITLGTELIEVTLEDQKKINDKNS